MKELRHWGFCDFFASTLPSENTQPCQIARVTGEERGTCIVTNGQTERLARPAGKLLHDALGRADLPAVGDWVVLRGNDETSVIERILPRRSILSRKAAGEDEHSQQILAVNVDVAFVVTSLNQDLNIRRLERYLVVAWEANIEPVVLLTKADLSDDVEGLCNRVRLMSGGVRVIPVSVIGGLGAAEVNEILGAGRTAVMLGSSGVGKSTLINYLAGMDVQATQSIRESDGRGRHTTTGRHLFRLPSGGMIIDTPGMRELAIWNGEDGVSHLFSDIEQLVCQCRFGNCQHESEPDCAILAALSSGQLDPGRWRSYLKLQREIAYREALHNPKAQLERKRRWKIKKREGKHDS